MITMCNSHNYERRLSEKADCSLGNILFQIASVIGIATKNGYDYGFSPWVNQEYFVNPLPEKKGVFKKWEVNKNYKGFDIGFQGFEIPDNSEIAGYLGSEHYFEHCKDLIRFYFTMKEICKPIKDTIIIHYRNYNLPAWYALDHNYYQKAVKRLPQKPILVVTDNIDAAYKAIKIQCDYTSNAPIIDFYVGCHADYIVMGNSSFSWWWAWLSRALTVAPLNWYDGPFKDCPRNDLYCKDWILC
jgi:hypothetical protein